MKKLIILSFICVLTAVKANSQTYLYQNTNGSYEYYWFIESTPFPKPLNEIHNNYYYYGYDSVMRKKIVDNNIKSFKTDYSTYKKGILKKTLVSYSAFSPSGLPTIYNDKKIIHAKNKEIQRRHTEILYTPFDEIKMFSSYKRNNKMRYRRVLTYDSTNLLCQSIYYKGKKIKYKGRTTYEWYSKDKAKLITYYKRKEIKPRVVSFDCLPEGRTEDTRKDTTTICLNSEYDANGNKVDIKITRNKKGKEFKTISRFNKNDKLIAYERYNSKGVFTYGWARTLNDSSLETSFINYGRNKVEKRKSIYEYDNKNRIIKSDNFKNLTKYKYGFEYTYNEDGKIIASKNFKRKHKLNYSTENKYENGNLVQKTHISKDGSKDKYIKTDTYEYNDKKLLTKETSSNKKIGLQETIKYEYDENNLYKKIEHFNRKNILTRAETYLVEYYK